MPNLKLRSIDFDRLFEKEHMKITTCATTAKRNPLLSSLVGTRQEDCGAVSAVSTKPGKA